MKKILLAVTALMMVGCTSSERKTKVKPQTNSNEFQTIVVDTCEYLIKSEYHCKNYSSTEWGYGYMAHKGNCHFCKERDSIKWEKRKKELEELVIRLKKK